MTRESIERFSNDVVQVIDEYRSGPLDDGLTTAEIVGVLECIKACLLREQFHEHADAWQLPWQVEEPGLGR